MHSPGEIAARLSPEIEYVLGLLETEARASVARQIKDPKGADLTMHRARAGLALAHALHEAPVRTDASPFGLRKRLSAAARAVVTAGDALLEMYGEAIRSEARSAGVGDSPGGWISRPADGTETYIWTSMHDRSVRARHQELDGTVQRWDDPPLADGPSKNGRVWHYHPGRENNCRCVAVMPTT